MTIESLSPLFYFFAGIAFAAGVVVLLILFNNKMKRALYKKNQMNRSFSLEGNRNFVKAILHSLADIVFVAKIEGNITFVNRSWNTITGTKTEEALSKTIVDLFEPEDSDVVNQLVEQALSGNNLIHRSNVRLKLERGRYRQVRLSVKLWQDSQTSESRIIGSIRDIEEQETTMKALKEAQEKYRDIVENSLEGIYQSSPQGRFLKVNKSMASILGYDSEQDLIDSIQDIKKDFYVDDKIRQELLDVINLQEGARGLEAQVWRKDGSKIWVSETCRPVKDKNNHIIYYEGTMTNVTDQKQAELNLRLAQEKSDMASRAKSEFLANMSHELRTPLNSVIGFAEILKDEIFGPLGLPQYKEYADDIHVAGTHLLNVINDILDVSKIEAGKRDLYEDTLHFQAVVESALTMVKSKAHEGAIRIEIDLADDLPLIKAEELALKQIMINLLSNAIKFSDKGGTVTVKAWINNRGQFEAFVKDTGVGMREADIEKALSAFGQVDSGLDKKTGGTGLGLTLVKQLVELHDGRLNVSSALGKGTKVTFTLPHKRVVTEQGQSRKRVT